MELKLSIITNSGWKTTNSGSAIVGLFLSFSEENGAQLCKVSHFFFYMYNIIGVVTL